MSTLQCVTQINYFNEFLHKTRSYLPFSHFSLPIYIYILSSHPCVWTPNILDLNFALFIFSIDMDYETKLWLVMIFFFSATYMQYYCVVGKPQVPCLFIFGDSLSDSGNNNNLHTDAKVNNLPYGIDFPLGPTGRFTNGRTSVDIISNNSILHICIFLSHGHVIFNFVTSSFLDYRCKNVLPVLPIIDLF